MAIIRLIEICNFRSIRHLLWQPQAGINCLIGRGDAGKSTVLDAIDLTLGARRQAAFTDADFHNLDVDTPIQLRVTVGALSDDLKNIETYGQYHGGRNATSGALEPEPALGLETTLTVSLTVGSDLQPVWGLVSARAAERGLTRDLSWSHRAAHAPTRLGPYAAMHFSWGPRSILNRLSEDEASAEGALAHAARSARSAFSDQSQLNVERTLEAITTTAANVGVPLAEARALLDLQGLSFSGASIAVHDGNQVPLRNLGLGSARLLVAGMQHRAAPRANIALIDEVEHGLEPHRIARLLHVLGAKASAPQHQVFMTTHSPVVLRELRASQLFVVRPPASPPGNEAQHTGSHNAVSPGTGGPAQATLRACAEGFLSPTVLVCEGKTEMGFVRGLDLHFGETGQASMGSLGIYPADGGGDNTYQRALVFSQLGYRTAILRDDDKQPSNSDVASAATAGISVFKWTDGLALEEQLFEGVPADCLPLLLALAVERCGEQAVDAHLRNASSGAFGLTDCQEDVHDEKRPVLGLAAKSYSWFKDIEPAERIGRMIVGPNLDRCLPALCETVRNLRTWMEHVPVQSRA